MQGNRAEFARREASGGMGSETILGKKPSWTSALREEAGPDGSLHAVWEFEPERALLEALLRDLFGNHYDSVVFGPCVEGAVFECRSASPPRKVGYRDGYLTVDFGDWHFHLCIGEHRGEPGHPCPPALARWRRCARAMLRRTRANPPVPGHAPVSYSLLLLNGRGEQMTTIHLPNPFYDADFRVLEAPDRGKLALRNHIRTRCLGLEADPGPFADLR